MHLAYLVDLKSADNINIIILSMQFAKMINYSI